MSPLLKARSAPAARSPRQFLSHERVCRLAATGSRRRRRRLCIPARHPGCQRAGRDRRLRRPLGRGGGRGRRDGGRTWSSCRRGRQGLRGRRAVAAAGHLRLSRAHGPGELRHAGAVAYAHLAAGARDRPGAAPDACTPGVTFVRDAGIADAGIRDSVAAGHVPGPTMQVSVVAIGSTGGHGDGFLGRPRARVLCGLLVARLSRAGRRTWPTAPRRCGRSSVSCCAPAPTG